MKKDQQAVIRTHRTTRSVSQNRPSVWIVFLCLVLSGCAGAGAGAIQLAGVAVGGAVNAVLESTGLRTPRAGHSGASVSISIDASPELNVSPSGEPLSVVLRLYQLKSAHGFAHLAYSQAQNEDMGADVLGNELGSVREMIILPGKHYEITLETEVDIRHIGIVALFHSPAHGRWKLAVERSNAQTGRVSLSLGACAITLTRDPAPAAPAAIETFTTSLRCAHA
ncbi:MAG: type VI secretion system lipoprotein TssJ [Azoarcus sp.]|nr:type VI secretion system lipoprotein TssJ [Azoarcus sp.]MDD2874212.1 type VI secretion system lipoprotein TssJ [Azoarcus sp.]MDX9838752.1 type VI secretion system lipoprotein TssJ [Azoarcus sp.]